MIELFGWLALAIYTVSLLSGLAIAEMTQIVFLFIITQLLVIIAKSLKKQGGQE